MKATVQGVLFSLLGGLAGGTAVVVLLLPEPISQVSSEIDDVLERSLLEGLEERVRALETVAERNREGMRARSVPKRESITNEDRSIATLTRQVADLRERLGLASWGSTADDANRVLEMLDRLRPRSSGSSRAGSESEVLRARARIPLRIRFLKQWGTHEQAHQELAGLVRDLLVSGQQARVRLELDRLGPKTNIAKWRVDVLRIRAGIPSSETVEIATRVVSSSADLPTKAWAMRMMGDSLEAMGQRERAIQTFETLMTRFRTCQRAQRHVSWARDRLDILAKQR